MDEETFKLIYAQFFPQGGESGTPPRLGEGARIRRKHQNPDPGARVSPALAFLPSQTPAPTRISCSTPSTPTAMELSASRFASRRRFRARIFPSAPSPVPVPAKPRQRRAPRAVSVPSGVIHQIFLLARVRWGIKARRSGDGQISSVSSTAETCAGIVPGTAARGEGGRRRFYRGD